MKNIFFALLCASVMGLTLGCESETDDLRDADDADDASTRPAATAPAEVLAQCSQADTRLEMESI